jgi:F-type H+-transporting ATPase subunit a
VGPHDTWYSLLPFWHDLEHAFEEGLRRDWQAAMFKDSEFSLVHVAGAVIAAIIVLVATFRYRASLHDETSGVVPPRRFTLAAMMDGFVGAVYKLSTDVMGDANARRYLPITCTLGLFLFCMNIQGLVPGFLPPTDTLKTNLALALSVFIIYVAVGIVRNPKHFLGEFLGPKVGGFYWLAPLFLVVETVSHIARPVSLSLRLMGNMMADHKVVGIMITFLAVLLPVPFLLLGTMVAIVQTLIFTLLTIIYIGLAVAHAEGH